MEAAWEFKTLVLTTNQAGREEEPMQQSQVQDLMGLVEAYSHQNTCLAAALALALMVQTNLQI